MSHSSCETHTEKTTHCISVALLLCVRSMLLQESRLLLGGNESSIVCVKVNKQKRMESLLQRYYFSINKHTLAT